MAGARTAPVSGRKLFRKIIEMKRNEITLGGNLFLSNSKIVRLLLSVLTILFVLFLNSVIFSQEISQPKNFHQWGAVTLFNGLPSDNVRAIAQTSDGILWFGTQNGLVRFDGRRDQRRQRACGSRNGRNGFDDREQRKRNHGGRSRRIGRSYCRNARSLARIRDGRRAFRWSILNQKTT